jgi:hypothetical protein
MTLCTVAVNGKPASLLRMMGNIEHVQIAIVSDNDRSKTEVRHAVALAVITEGIGLLEQEEQRGIEQASHRLIGRYERDQTWFVELQFTAGEGPYVYLQLRVSFAKMV